MFGSPYYHETIYRFIAGFGTIFNNIMIARLDSEENERYRFRVPVEHIEKRKFHHVLIGESLRQDSTDQDREAYIQNTLPKITYYIADVSPYTQRKTQNVSYCEENTDGSFTKFISRVPYRLNVEMGVFSKKQADGFKILEQVLPHFRPSLTMNMRSKNFNELTEEIVISLTGVSRDYEIETSFMDSNLDVYSWTFSFSVDLYFYSEPKETNSIIKTVDVQFYDQDDGGGFEKIVVEVDPEDAEFGSFGISQGVFLIEEGNN